MEVSNFLKEAIVGALRISGPRSFHASIQNGKKLLENLAICNILALNKGG